jgi:hypothetical protein
MTGSQDLFAARWDGGLPGGLAAGRRPAFGINALEPPLAASLLQLVGAAEDIERAEVVAKSALLAVLVAQVGTGTYLWFFMHGIIWPQADGRTEHVFHIYKWCPGQRC